MRLPAAGAIVLVLGGLSSPAAAADRPEPQAAPAYLATGEAQDSHASDLIGRPLHAAPDRAGAPPAYLGAVGDLLLGGDGRVRAVLVDIGPYLGAGSKTVAIPLEALRLAGDAAGPGGGFLQVVATRATLAAAPAYRRSPDGARLLALAPAVEDGRQRGARSLPLRPSGVGTSMFDADRYRPARRAELAPDDLVQAPVYGPGDSKIGTVKALTVSDGGAITEAVIDVGGILGMGGHAVLVPFVSLKVLRRDSDGALRVETDMTRARLEALPRHDG